MESTLKGGCACGAIQYQISAYPEFSMICQCRQCQRITGAGHSAQVMVSSETVTIVGNVKYFDLKADDGNAVRSGFCENCGNPILKTSSGFPGKMMFHAATLDNPADYKPQIVIYSQYGQSWDYVNPLIPRK